MLTDGGRAVQWWVRSNDTIEYIQRRHHNPHYLSSAYFDVSLLHMHEDVNVVIENSDVVVMVVPSAYIREVLEQVKPGLLNNKKVLSAIKGLVPGPDLLLNEYLHQQFGFPLEQYYTLLGPCHAEEVASEKLSYLTFSGLDAQATGEIAAAFRTPYINTIINNDILGVQYASVLKNIYALGAGMAHGLEYGDNFLSVYIANSADEMASFLRTVGAEHIGLGEHHTDTFTQQRDLNYAASVYLGDLLVTCYSPYSRNRTFGNMIGKGYTVRSAQLELNMVAEGYNAAKCMFNINKHIGAEMPIASTIYRILWEKIRPKKGFEEIEKVMN